MNPRAFRLLEPHAEKTVEIVKKFSEDLKEKLRESGIEPEEELGGYASCLLTRGFTPRKLDEYAKKRGACHSRKLLRRL